MTDVKLILQIANATFSAKDPWNRLAQDICRNFYPIKADYTEELDLEDFAGDLTDGSPLLARETLGNAIDAMLCQGDWFKAGTGDPDRDKRPANAVALQRATVLMRGQIKNRRSGWMAAKKDGDMDWVSVGNPVMAVDESADRSHLVFHSFHPRDCAWTLDENGQHAEMFFRRDRKSARHIVERCAKGRWSGTPSQEIADAARDNPTKMFDMMHCMVPIDMCYGRAEASSKRYIHKYMSLWIDPSNERLMHESAKPNFAYIVARQRRIAGKPWGFSSYALNSLADARMLQDMALVLLEQGQKAVDPPTIGDSQVFTRDMNFMAGGHTEVDLGEARRLQDVFATIDTGQRINVGVEMKQDVRNLLAEAWLLNKLMLPTLRDMREVEVMVRTEEFRRAALPFFAPIEEQYHKPLLSMAFDTMATMGMFPAGMFPQELRGNEVDFSFESPLNEAEGRKVVEKFFSDLQVLAAGAQVDQTVSQIYDVRQAAEDAILATGKPEWLKSEEERKQGKADAEAVQQLRLGAQVAREGAGVVSDVANASMTAQQAGMTSGAPAPMPAV